MKHDPRTTRRRMLQLSGAVAVAGLAGCTESGTQSDDQGGNGANSTPTPTESPDQEGGHHDEGEEKEEGHHDKEEEGGHNDEEEEGGHDEEEEGGHDDEEEGGHNEEEEGGHHDEGKEKEEGHHDEEEEEGDGHGHNHDEGTLQGPSPSATVSLQTSGSGQHYAPHVVWIEPGGSVTWELESGSHDVIAYHPDNDRPLRMPEAADPWSTDLLSEEGATAEQTFETEGVYDYFCTPHEAVGMVGTVIVGEPDAHDQPGLAEPDSSLPDGARSELADLNKKVNEALGHTH